MGSWKSGEMIENWEMVARGDHFPIFNLFPDFPEPLFPLLSLYLTVLVQHKEGAQYAGEIADLVRQRVGAIAAPKLGRYS